MLARAMYAPPRNQTLLAVYALGSVIIHKALLHYLVILDYSLSNHCVSTGEVQSSLSQKLLGTMKRLLLIDRGLQTSQYERQDFVP
jgi:hypothetical protein